MLDLPLASPEIDLLVRTEQVLKQQQQQQESKYRPLEYGAPRDSS